MILRYELVSNGIRLNRDEWDAIIQESKRCLQQAFSDVTLASEAACLVAWGWRYRWDAVKRDRDGSLLISIAVWDSTNTKVLTRKCRLVKQRPLTLSPT